MKKTFISQYKEGQYVGTSSDNYFECSNIYYVDLSQQEVKENTYSKYKDVPCALSCIRVQTTQTYNLGHGNTTDRYNIHLCNIASISNKTNTIYFKDFAYDDYRCLGQKQLQLTSASMVELASFFIKADEFLKNTVETQTEESIKNLLSPQSLEQQEKYKESELLGNNLNIQFEDIDLAGNNNDCQ